MKIEEVGEEREHKTEKRSFYDKRRSNRKTDYGFDEGVRGNGYGR